MNSPDTVLAAHPPPVPLEALDCRFRPAGRGRRRVLEVGRHQARPRRNASDSSPAGRPCPFASCRRPPASSRSRSRRSGTVTPINTVTVRSRLDGELMRVLFTEGQSVGAGQLLAEIDPRPFQSQLTQVLGQQQENQARLKNAEGDLERYQKLVAEGLITKQQVTTQEALVQQYRGRPAGQRRAGGQRAAAAGLHQDRRAHRRPAGPAAGGRRQPDSRRRRQRPRRHHADAAHLGDLHRARSRAAGGARGAIAAASAPQVEAWDRVGSVDARRRARCRPSTTRSTRRPARSSCARSSTTPTRSCSRTSS